MGPFLVGLAVSLAVTGAMIPVLARVGMWDVANHRSSHTGAIARGGGVGVIAGMSAGVLATGFDQSRAGWICALWILAMAAVGLVDDLRGMPVRPRLLGQFVLAAVASVWLASATQDGWTAALPAVVGGLWLVSYVNAFNFMDGINGISALSAAVAGGWYAWLGGQLDSTLLTVFGLALVGACLGFLPWNAPRARVFLGDVGSYGVGAAIAVLALVAWLNDAGLAHTLAPLTVYLADTGVVLVQRARRGESLGDAHRDHVYQRLVDAGWSHSPVALMVAGVAVVISVLVAVFPWPVAVGLGLLVLAGYEGLPLVVRQPVRVG